MHTVNDGKIKVRQALVSSLSVMRAASGDVAVIDEAWKLEKQFRAEISTLEKEEREPQFSLAGEEKHAA